MLGYSDSNRLIRQLAIANHWPVMGASPDSKGLRPTLDLNFLTGVLDSRITASGGTNGTRVGANGLIAAAATPRFDYDPATLLPKGLLIEEQRTNLFQQSAALDNVYWAKQSGATVLADASTSPDGAANADRVSFATTPLSAVYRNSIPATGTLTISIYAKGVSGGEKFRFVCYNATDGQQNGVDIALSTSWARYSATFTVSMNSNWYFANASDNVLRSVDFYGAQLELGGFATSYIPTTSVSVTRSVDSLTMTEANFSSWFNLPAGTFIAEFALNQAALGTGNHGIYSAYLDANNCTISYTNNVSGTLVDEIISVGVLSCGMSSAAQIVANTIYKDAFAYGANSFARSLSAATVQTDNSGQVPLGLNVFRLGQDDSSVASLDGHIRRLTYYPNRLPNSLLVTLST